MKRKIYLKDKPREEALIELLQHFSPERQTEKIASVDSLGRDNSGTGLCENVESSLSRIGNGWHCGKSGGYLCCA